MYNEEYLEHHGILGQKWGVRRYQNPDGSYTAAGKARYGEGKTRTSKNYSARLNDVDRAIAYNRRDYKEGEYQIEKIKNKATKKGMVDEKGKFNFTDSKAGQKLKAKYESAKDLQKIAEKNVKSGQKEVSKIINEAKKAGYTVQSKEIYRPTMRGKEYVKIGFNSAMFGPIVGAALSAATTPGYKVSNEGTLYKVGYNNPKVPYKKGRETSLGFRYE